MKIGYARVSTTEQNNDLQIDALKTAGCDEIFFQHGVSVVAKKRPVFEEALAKVGQVDQLVIWKFDRSFRSLSHSLEVLGQLEERGAG